jgi:hypothetical protein
VAVNGIKEVFIIGGDVDVPKYYEEALPFMKDFLDNTPGVSTIGKLASHLVLFSE